MSQSKAQIIALWSHSNSIQEYSSIYGMLKIFIILAVVLYCSQFNNNDSGILIDALSKCQDNIIMRRNLSA